MNFLVGLVTLGGAVLLALGIAMQIAAPVIDLGSPDGLAERAIRKARTGGMGGMSSGEESGFAVRNDEIGELHREFRRMTEKIEDAGRRRHLSRSTVVRSLDKMSRDSIAQVI